MPYLLIFGIVCIAIPLIAIEAAAHIIFFGFMRDDGDTSSILTFALGLMAFGAIMVGIHFILQFSS